MPPETGKPGARLSFAYRKDWSILTNQTHANASLRSRRHPGLVKIADKEWRVHRTRTLDAHGKDFPNKTGTSVVWDLA
jgi:hypothetical protein